MKQFLVVLLGALACVECSASQSQSLVPCDKHDHAAQVDLLANSAQSKLEQQVCKGDAECIRLVLVKRDAYVFRRCALPDDKVN